MSDDWTGPPAYLERLRAAGVLAEVEAIWDAIDRGENPCGDAIDLDEAIARMNALIAAKEGQ